MFTTTHAFPAIAKRNLGKFISFSWFALVFIANMNVSPANARLLTSLTSTEVIVSENYITQITVTECEGGVEFRYLQRVIINGKPVMVPVEYVYPAGTHQMNLEGTCDGLNLYGVSTCSCLETPVISLEFFPAKELGTMTDQELEKAPNEIYNTRPTWLFEGSKSGELWIRKNLIENHPLFPR
jgi:hypothetical protein